jgi:ribosomal-protein-alanine acetyltransferase
LRAAALKPSEVAPSALASMSHPFTIRPAVLSDLDALERLENRAFEGDRLSRRSLRHFIIDSKDALLVADRGHHLAGYALVTFRSGTALARLYSIAVSPETGRSGVGRALMTAAEKIATERDCIVLRLEVRADNKPAIALYHKLGYKQFGVFENYYEDDQAALRFEKILVAPIAAPAKAPPYYRQTLEFTCGPACLLMALAWADPSFRPDRAAEVRLWREATTIFMTSGLGGCEPYGLAVTLAKRGLHPSLHLSQQGPFFLDTVRNDEKREVMRLTQEEFRREAEHCGTPVHLHPLDTRSLQGVFDEGAIAIVLVSGYRMFHEKFPHWLLAYAGDGRHVFVNDPYVETKDEETAVSATNLPIPCDEFQRMARYGKGNLRAAIVVRKGEHR